MVTWTSRTRTARSACRHPSARPGADFLAPVFLSPDGGDAFDPRVSAGRRDGSHVDPHRCRRGARRGGDETRGRELPPRPGASAPGADASAPQVGVGEDGTAVATWFVGAGERVDAAVGNTTAGTFQPAGTLSAPTVNASEPQVAVDEQGNAVVVWTAGNGTTHVQSAHRPRGGASGRPSDVSEPAPPSRRSCSTSAATRSRCGPGSWASPARSRRPSGPAARSSGHPSRSRARAALSSSATSARASQWTTARRWCGPRRRPPGACGCSPRSGRATVASPLCRHCRIRSWTRSSRRSPSTSAGTRMRSGRSAT